MPSGGGCSGEWVGGRSSQSQPIQVLTRFGNTLFSKLVTFKLFNQMPVVDTPISNYGSKCWLNMTRKKLDLWLWLWFWLLQQSFQRQLGSEADVGLGGREDGGAGGASGSHNSVSRIFQLYSFGNIENIRISSFYPNSHSFQFWTSEYLILTSGSNSL